MTKDTLPRRTVLSDRILLSMPEGTSKVLEVMAADADFETVGAYCRGIIEREIKTVKPEDFKRLRGVG